MFRILPFLVLLTIGFNDLLAQRNVVFYPSQAFPISVDYEKSVADQSGAESQALKIVTQLMNHGYLVASLDSIVLRNDTAFASFHIGNKFNWGKINYKYLAKPLIEQFGFNRLTNNELSLGNLEVAMTQTISFFENRGYPFAYFYWDSLVIKNDSIYGSLYFEKNIAITFDTLALYGESGLSKSFLYNYLNFKPGDLFSETVINQLSNKINKLPFAYLMSKPLLFFVDRKAIVVLNLKKRKTDRLDGIIGFAPYTAAPGASKLLVTGEFHLDFKNLKGTGKGFKIEWQSFKAQSQALNVTTTLPYLFNQPIGVELKGDFLKYDTTYTEATFGAGIHYIFSGLDNVKIFYELKNTNLLSVDTASLRISKQLGNITAMETDRYGMAIDWITFNNRLSPTKGFLTNVSASIYRRKIEEDYRIEKVKFYSPQTGNYYDLYDSLNKLSYQILLQYNFAKPILLTKRVVIFNELNGYHFISPKVYFNELYRFGGNKTLRGFNEQSLFASSVAIFNMEVRYLLSENSFIKLFGNGAYYTNNSQMTNRIDSDFPYGFGAGLNLETGGGIFNISTALGKSKYNPIEFKNAKIHFGLINYF
jgi:hypothetical protein